MQKTPEQIRTIGLAVLKRELGADGLIQFLQQFDPGSGNWAQERHDWVDRTTLGEIRKATAKRRRQTKNGRKPR